MSLPTLAATSRTGVGGGQHLLELAGAHDDALGAGLPRSGHRLVGELVPSEHDACVRVAQVEGDLAPLEQHVHRHHDPARAQDAVVGDGELRHVGQHDPDAVAGLHAVLAQEPGELGGEVVEGAVGQHRVIEAHSRQMGAALGAVGSG